MGDVLHGAKSFSSMWSEIGQCGTVWTLTMWNTPKSKNSHFSYKLTICDKAGRCPVRKGRLSSWKDDLCALIGVFMHKPFTTIEDQIALLNSRGLQTDSRTSWILEREGYYATVNGYKKPFLDNQARKKMKKTNIAKDPHTMTCISCTCLIGSSVFSFSEWSRLLRRFWKQSAHTNSPRQIRLRGTPTLISTIMLVPEYRQLCSYRPSSWKGKSAHSAIAKDTYWQQWLWEKRQKRISRSLPQWARWRGAVVGFDQWFNFGANILVLSVSKYIDSRFNC